MTKINIYAVFEGVPRIWLTVEVAKDKAQEVGSGYAALAVATDPRISNAWWDYAE